MVILFQIAEIESMNYYFILGIDTDATDTEIKDAYRKLVLKYHPDHFGDDSSPFLKIQEAYQVLSNPDLKRKYDNSLLRLEHQARPVKSRRPGRGWLYLSNRIFS